MAALPYESIPPAPETFSGASVLTRLVDAIGFRFRWATEGLDDGDLDFKPAPDCMSLGELLQHVHSLIRWVAQSVGIAPIEGFTDREATLELAGKLRERFESMSETELGACTIRTSRGDAFPVWNIVNGPLSDALTHIGQIASWRRIKGKPVAGADVFRGRPPAGAGGP